MHDLARTGKNFPPSYTPWSQSRPERISGSASTCWPRRSSRNCIATGRSATARRACGCSGGAVADLQAIHRHDRRNLLRRAADHDLVARTAPAASATSPACVSRIAPSNAAGPYY